MSKIIERGKGETKRRRDRYNRTTLRRMEGEEIGK